MKADIHPTLNPVVFVDTTTGDEFVTTSTLTSEETKKIDGVEHFVIKVEVSSASHPFYTGKQTLVDTAGRVDKFRARAEAAEKLKAENVKRNEEKAGTESVEEKMTRKAMEKEEEKAAKKEKEAAKKKEVAKKEAEETVVKAEDQAQPTGDDSAAQDDSAQGDDDAKDDTQVEEVAEAVNEDAGEETEKEEAA